MRVRWSRPAAVLLATSLTLVGCSESGSEPTRDRATTESDSPSPSGEPTATTPKPDPAYDRITFVARDGERRPARLYGAGATAVVLSHMGRGVDGPDDWDGFARQLADHGIRAVTYRRRPAYDSMWKDVLGAAEFLRDHGAKTVVAGGASIGAMASLRAAEDPRAELDGVIWLAGVLFDSGYEFQRADVSGIHCPVLVVSGDDDDYGAAPDARRLHRWLTGPKELLILDSDQHGTDILKEDGANPRELSRTMLRFVERTARGSTARC